MLGQGDPHADHPDRDIVVFSKGKRPVKRFLAVPIVQFKLVADIDLPSATGGTAWDEYRHYWRLAAGMDGGTVAMLDGFKGLTKPAGGWPAEPVYPTPYDPKILARRVFGLETFNRASAALVSSFQARTAAGTTVESKFAWCVMTSYLVNMCWLSLNTYPAWMADTMRLYLAGGPETLNSKELTRILGMPWPKGARGPFGGYKYAALDARYTSTDPRRTIAKGRWPEIYTGWDKDPVLRWDNLDAALSRKFGIPNSKDIYGLENPSRSVGRINDFEIPHILGRNIAQRAQWMRKLSFFMPYSAWMGTVFSGGGQLREDLVKARRITPEFAAIVQMWSLFGTPSRTGEAARSYFDTLAMYKNTAAKNLTYKDTNGGTNYGLEYYFSYALPLWADFFGNKADFSSMVQCNHAAWNFAQTHSGPQQAVTPGGGVASVGAHNTISETTTASYGLPCDGLGDTAPLGDVGCAASLTIPEYDNLARDDVDAKKTRAVLMGTSFLVKIVKAFIQAYTGNLVGLGFTVKDTAQMFVRYEKEAKNTKSFSTVVRSVPPPFLRNINKLLNSVAPVSVAGTQDDGVHRVHPKTAFQNNPSVRFSTDPFVYWDWATVKANGAVNSRELEIVQRAAGGDPAALDDMPQAMLYSMQVDTALRNLSTPLGVKLHFVQPPEPFSEADVAELTAESVAAARVAPSALLLAPPTSKLPVVATGLVVAAASIILLRRRGRR